MTNIYCDGACKGNPGPSGSGLYIQQGRKNLTLSGMYAVSGTNNSAELYALLEALRVAEMLNGKIKIFADSTYAIDSVTKWAYTWKANNWTKKGGIKNINLIKEAHKLFDLMKNRVTIEYVKGHSGNKGNDKADKAANVAIKRKMKEWGKSS